MTPEIRVERGDVVDFDCDVLVLKYAQARYGADEAVARALRAAGTSEEAMSPQPGAFRVLEAGGAIAATEVMFAGVDPLRHFGYRSIRMFARKALADLAGRDPAIRHVGFTMHGVGYGLDEREAFESLVAGLLDAVGSGDVPRDLVEIAIVERSPSRVNRLADYLSQLDFGPDEWDSPVSGVDPAEVSERLREVGYASDGKPHVFVAMPLSDAKSDHYHYGIQGAVHAAGFLCERVDLTAFTGDVLERIKERIETAEMVVADLSGGNPNVYLEVGYAWGKGVPTVLIADDADELRFDVQGQRCIPYTTIRDLESKLTAELTQLRAGEDPS